MNLQKLLLFLVFFLILVVVSVVYVWFIWLPQTSLENKYLNIMKFSNSTETKTRLRSDYFERDYNFTELYKWVNETIRFVPLNETTRRHTSPFEILESGKGRCEEFSILYVAVCLAHGYQSRLIVTLNVTDGIDVGPHMWAEVMLDNSWVHVDPSDQIWGERYRYEKWDWGKDIGTKIKIYAFEDGTYEDVTLKYKS